MHTKIYISPSREYYPAPTIPLAEMQPKYCIPASEGFVIISVHRPRERRCTWKFTFPPRGNTIQRRQFRLRKCNQNIASPQAEVCYYFSSCPRLRKCTESCAFPRAEMRSGCYISASRKCRRMCAVPQAVLHIKRSKKIVLSGVRPLKAYLVNIALFHKTVQKRARIKIKFHIFPFFSAW